MGDILEVERPGHVYVLWHDRAVFHCLTEPEARRRSLEAVRRALKPGGQVPVATLGPEGPERCSGLDAVARGAGAVKAVSEQHHSPRVRRNAGGVLTRP